MRMFSNYQDLAHNYIPNNLMYTFPSCVQSSKLNPVDASKPYEEYNLEGKLIGYFWNYGETLNLDFTIDGELTIEADAIILTSYGQIPTSSTSGYVGQRCYNIADLVSWTCTSNYDDIFVWTQDVEFTYPPSADKHVYISAHDFLKNQKVDVTLYNFRMEPIVKRTYDGATQIIFEIDSELSKSLVKGIYYCSVQVYTDTMCQTIFSSNDCKLLVK